MQTIPDVSFWQSNPDTGAKINFALMRTKTPAVILRAGQNTWTDRDFKHNWKAAKAAGLARGAYWFYDSRTSAKVQAGLFADLLKDDPPELLAWFDAEEKYGGAFAGWQNWYNFMERFKDATGIPQGIYTGYYYWTERVQSADAQRYFSQYPLWIAAYNPTAPLVPKPWKDWDIWQFTDNGDGTQYGVHSLNIDLNHCKMEIPEVGNLPTMTLDAKYSGKVVRYERNQ